MKIQTKLTLKYTFSILVALLCAHLLQKINTEEVYAVSYFIRIVVFVIYMGMLAFWGASIDRRITNHVIKNTLMVTDGILILWLFFRTMKFYVLTDPKDIRIMWYCFYACLLAVVLCFFIGTDCMVNKDVSKRLNNGFFMGIPTLLLSVIVVTNESHGFVFRLPVSEENVRYGLGYYIIVVWIVSVVILSIVRISVAFDEKDYRKKLLRPFLVLFVAGLYLLLYAFDIYPARTFDFSVSYFCIIIGMWESLIVTGMIPSNVEYEWCFNHSVVKSQILDDKGNIVYSALTSIPIVREEFEELKKEGHFYHDKNTEFLMAKIAGGYVAWEKNVRDIRLLMSDLEETEKSISEANESVRANIEILAKKKKTEEKIKLYDMTFSKVSEDVLKLENIIAKAEGLEGGELRRALIRIDVSGVYLKRKSNLILLKEQRLEDFSEELNLCFKESFDNLSDAGIEGRYAFFGISGIDNETALKIYECFEIGIESCLDDLSGVFCMLTKKEASFVLVVDMKCISGVDPDDIKKKVNERNDIFTDFDISDNDVSISFTIQKEVKSDEL